MKKSISYAWYGIVSLLSITLVWLTNPNGMQIVQDNRNNQPQIEQSARTVKSRRKQRLRQQRCQTAALAQLQAVQKKLFLERSRFQETHPIIQDLREQEKAKLAAVEKCGQTAEENEVKVDDENESFIW
jgi:uncharacterized protein involved in exopolysaccharide biosynthesis